MLADPRVARASVRIAKPDLLAGATPAVTLHAARRVTRALLGLGANLGDPVATLLDAKARLGDARHRDGARRRSTARRRGASTISRRSSTRRSRSKRRSIRMRCSPRSKRSKRELGRVATFRWGPRAIDLDILAYDGVRRSDPDLTIPHARLNERAFVLVPLAEIDPAFAAARDALPATDVAAVERIGAFEREGSQR